MRNKIMIIGFKFLRSKNYVHEISSRNSTQVYSNKFHIKIYLESFVSIYHLYYLFGIITLNYWFISKTINTGGIYL